MTRSQALAPLLAVSVLIALTITAFITYLNIGWQADFLFRWLRAAAFALAVMLPIGGLVMTLIGRAVDKTLAGRAAWQRRVLASLLMGFTMEAVASAIATATNLGLDADFGAHWLQAYLRALPLGMVIGLLMGFVVRPWMDARLARIAPAPSAAAPATPSAAAEALATHPFAR